MVWSDNLVGATWMLGAAVLVVTTSGLLKGLRPDVPLVIIAAARMIFGVLLMAPFLWRAGFGILVTRRLPLHILRTVLGLGSFLLIAYVVSRILLADLVAIQFTTPFWSILLSVIFLGEAVRARRWLATAVGFVGVLFIAGPRGGIEPAMVLALVNAVMVSTIAILLRHLGRTEDPLTTVFYFHAFGAVLMLPLALWSWQAPTPLQWVLLFGVGAAAVLGQYCFTRAFQRGDISVVAPMDFMQLPFATVIGFAVFGELPDGWGFLGIVLILFAAYYIVRRETERRRERMGENA